MGIAETRRDRCRQITHRYRSVPGQHGLRVHTAALIHRRYSGDTGASANYTEEIPIVERGGFPPKIRWLKDDEIAVGSLMAGTVEIGPITPEFSGGGTDFADIVGRPLDRGDTLHVRITGPQHPDGALYRIARSSADKALHYTIQAVPVSEVVP